MPAAVIVATVADRWPAGCRPRPASRAAAREMFASAAASADDVADPGVDQHLLEPAAGGDDEQDAGDRRAASRRGSPRSSAGRSPTAVPRVNIASDHTGQQRDHRVADDVEHGPQAVALVEGQLADRPQQHEHDRQQDGQRRSAPNAGLPPGRRRRPGRRRSGRVPLAAPPVDAAEPSSRRSPAPPAAGSVRPALRAWPAPVTPAPAGRDVPADERCRRRARR